MSPVFRSALYHGAVTHKRLRPQRHRLRYALSWMLIDLDELGPLDAGLRLFSHNRFNLYALFDRDHLAGSARPLRPQVEAHLEAAGIRGADGPIRLLCLPRILGYAFNPLSLYLCYGADGTLAAILYEVNNTFGQRHCYVAPCEKGTLVRQSADKAFYVSPFLPMDLTYEFRVLPPAERLSVAITARDQDGPVIATHFGGRHRALSDGALLGAFSRHPVMALGVVAGIHWEALKLWRKGLRLVARPTPPGRPITRGHAVPERRPAP